MTTRYTAQGAMIENGNGKYVLATDFEALAKQLQTILLAVPTYFEKIESGDLSAKDAKTSLEVITKLL